MNFAAVESVRVERHGYYPHVPGFMFPVDTYDRWFMLMVDEGAFAYRIGDLAGRATVGDVVVCPPGMALDRKAEGRISFQFVEFDLIPEQRGGKGRCARVPDLDRLANTCQRLREREPYCDTTAIRHLVLDLLYLADPESHPQAQPITDPIVAQALESLAKRALQRFHIREIAAEAALSPVQLVRRFRAATGQTPRQHVEAIRLAHARRLLSDTDYTLDSIADQCGYESAFYLSRLFKQRTGVSPSEYRTRNRV